MDDDGKVVILVYNNRRACVENDLGFKKKIKMEMEKRTTENTTRREQRVLVGIIEYYYRSDPCASIGGRAIHTYNNINNG